MQELKIAMGEAGLVLCSALKQGVATEVEGGLLFYVGAKTFPENWVSKQSFFVLILTTA
jgi:hypothetical protein